MGLAGGWHGPAEIDHLRAIHGEAGDRTAHAALDGHPAGQVNRPTDLQREGTREPAQRQLRTGGLPGVDERRYPALPHQPGAGGHGSITAY